MSEELITALGGRFYRTDRNYFAPADGMVTDVTVTPDGLIHVLLRRDPLVDPLTPAIVTLTQAGEVLREWAGGDIADAHMLASGADGTLYVVDRDAHEVVLLRDGGRVGGIGHRHQPGAPFNHPTGIAIAADGSIFVCEGYAGHTIWHFAADGTEITRWGSFGTAPGAFRNAHGLCCLTDGSLAVADRENDRVQVFAPDGELLQIYDGFYGPMDVWGEPSGALLVSDSFPSLTRIEAGTGSRSRSRPVLNGAHGIFGAADGTIYFAESNPNRVSRILPVATV